MSHTISGQFVDLHLRDIYPASVHITDDRIASITRVKSAPDHYILPGFIDAHIHIESSMLVPYEFAKVALRHGTVATVSDPHEIANVMGVEGVLYMIENAKEAPLKFHFGAPSCVPATSFETAGATIDSDDVRALLEMDDIFYLSEMMNYPGVLHGDEEVLKKIQYAKELSKPVDGHAPGLRGSEAQKYIEAGISTDHECFTIEEALEKLKCGMKILIREGSAAKNYNALHPLIATHPDQLMFCSDDKHPDDLLEGHVNLLVRRSVQLGYDLFDVLRMACILPVEHYNLEVGMMRVGDLADFIIVKDLVSFDVISTFINGIAIVENEKQSSPDKQHTIINQFNITKKRVSDFTNEIPETPVPVIVALDGEIVTEVEWVDMQLINQEGSGIQKICVVNRYHEAPVAIGYIKNFGLSDGAIASTVAHDSHNVIAVGSEEKYICRAVNLLVESKGGLSVVSDMEELHLPLPIAGLMSDLPCDIVAAQYQRLASLAKDLGCCLTAPFMTLSFMALLVIPKLKISDKGMFDAVNFKFIESRPTS